MFFFLFFVKPSYLAALGREAASDAETRRLVKAVLKGEDLKVSAKGIFTDWLHFLL